VTHQQTFVSNPAPGDVARPFCYFFAMRFDVPVLAQWVLLIIAFVIIAMIVLGVSTTKLCFGTCFRHDGRAIDRLVTTSQADLSPAVFRRHGDDGSLVPPFCLRLPGPG
jgi:hypothetical protein